MIVFKLSVPTVSQLLHSAERVVGVFLVAAGSMWQVSNFSVDKATLRALVFAGFTAVYQLILNSVTTLGGE